MTQQHSIAESPALLDPMTALQNRWYNGLAAGLAADPAMLQLIQPAPPLPQADAALWACENLVPPASLTFYPSVVSGGRFFDEYAAVVSELQFPQSSFEHDIGASVYQQWTAYVSKLKPPPAQNQLPGLFMSWAMQNAPSVASQGTSDLTTMALISSAQQALAPYEGPSAKPADFAGSFAELLQTLMQSSGAHFSFDSSTTSSDVSNTWTGGADAVFYGLWAGYSGAGRLSLAFAQSDVTVSAVFKSYAVWRSTPGAWYDSSMLQNAYGTQATPPWPANPNPAWGQIFGAQGSMRQLIASLLVVDGMNITITSDAIYSSLDQQTILRNAASGLWPFFVPSSDVAANAVTFGAAGMQIETATQPGNPVVIGANVLGIASYVG